MKARYKITYELNGAQHKAVRRAYSAAFAVTSYAWQYGQRYTKVHLVDVETLGQQWAEVAVYNDRGCQDWVYTAFAERIEEE